MYFIIMLFFILFLYSGYKIISYLNNNNENKEIKEFIRNNFIEEIKKDEDEIVLEEQLYKIDFKSLKEQNKDTIAYLKVYGTNIDYIVVKGMDNSYYLKHNFNKNWNVSGWIFADYHNKFDNNDKNIVIFGHNTRDGSMFGTLKNILNKEWYENEENYEIILVTEKDTYYYQVFSTYQITPEDYYINTIFNNDEEYIDFLNKIKSRSIYNYNVEVNSNDKVLTLSSCIGDGKKRVVLHAKLLSA